MNRDVPATSPPGDIMQILRLYEEMVPVLLDLGKRLPALEGVVNRMLTREDERLAHEAAPARRWLSTAAVPVEGTVVSNGGGCMSMVVSQDTDEYLPVGTRIIVWAVESEFPRPEPQPDQWEDVVGFAKYNGAGETLYRQGGTANLNAELVGDGWHPLVCKDPDQ